MSEAWLGRIGAATSISSAAKYSQGERLNATHFNSFAKLRRVTSSPIGHILTNAQVWSADGKWIYFDARSDRHGGVFDGREIRRVHVQTGEENVVYRAVGQACCGVVLAHPLEEKIVFIHGPEYPNSAWSYGAARRGGMVLNIGRSFPERLDARDMVEPFTPGAHRGGSHVHQFSPAGDWISFTYEDEYLEELLRGGCKAEKNQRNIGIAIPNVPVSVLPRHPRNQSATYYTLVCTETWDAPQPGSDQIQRAYEESWVGARGYQKLNGTQQNRALVFLGDLILSDGRKATELFIVDIPDNVAADDQAYRSTVAVNKQRLKPTPAIRQRRLTHLLEGFEPGLQGVRFWPRSTPDGAFVFVLKKDRHGVTQFWRVKTSDGQSQQWTHNPSDVSTSFTISADGRWLAHGMDGSVCVTSCLDGKTIRVTESFGDEIEILPEAMVWNPTGNAIAFVSPQRATGSVYNQIFVVDVDRTALDRM